ncbi:MAG: hypothetical protein AAFN11_07205 [Chloroflexota bacterium]
MPALLEIFLRILVALGGMWLAYFTINTTIRVFVLPRGENAWLARQIFTRVYSLFLLAAYKKQSFEQRDAVLAMFAPVVLLIQPVIYLALLVIAFTPIYWSLDNRSSDWLSFYALEEAFFLSGSSLMTLGFAPVGAHNIPTQIISFSQAGLGMMFVALLIAYLPTIYNAFSMRETLVAMLESRAGSPPSPVTLLTRIYQNAGSAETMRDMWMRWEEWFAQIEESHTSLVALVFFRSPMPDRHWVTAAGTVLDAAALLDAVIDEPRTLESVICIRAGFVSLRRIADYFGGTIPYDPNCSPDDPISIGREEFDEVYDQLVTAGLPVVPDRDQAWRDFAGWRVNYDSVLLGLARITSAPYGMWSSDRTTMELRNVPGMQPFGNFDYQPRYEKKREQIQQTAIGD